MDRQIWPTRPLCFSVVKNKGLILRHWGVYFAAPGDYADWWRGRCPPSMQDTLTLTSRAPVTTQQDGVDPVHHLEAVSRRGLDVLLLHHFRFQTMLSSNVFFLSIASRRVTAHPYFVTVFVMLRSENSRLTVKQHYFLESRKVSEQFCISCDACRF